MRLNLLRQVTCPRCWKSFIPEDVKWIAAHGSLIGDPIAGDEAARRFLPSRFTPDGNAYDEEGQECRQLACPRCHGVLHDGLLVVPTLYLSIFGAPQSGKSFYLGGMLHELQTSACRAFGLTFKNVDAVANARPMRYAGLFESSAEDNWVTIPRTQPFEDDYHTAHLNGQDVVYPAPYIFQMSAADTESDSNRRRARMICMYDVAGETFLPGFPSERRPLGDHLALSKASLFVFDPTLQPGFRAVCAERSKDPQFDGRLVKEFDQSDVIASAAERVRVLSKASATEKSKKTLVIILSKYDAWHFLLNPRPLKPSEAISVNEFGQPALNVSIIEQISRQLQELMLKLAPKIVTAAESAFTNVVYLPATATSGPPQLRKDDDGEQKLMFQRRSLRPSCTAVPVLYALSVAQEGEPDPLIPVTEV